MNGIVKKEFYSQLFKKTIKADDLEYAAKVLAEALYKLREYETRNCTCLICQNNKQKLNEYVKEKFKIKNS